MVSIYRHEITTMTTLATQLKQSSIPLLLINQEFFGKRSYNPQSHILLSDIRNYVNTFNITQKMYKDQWLNDGETWADWWSNDLYGWGNQHHPIMNGYVEKMYSIWEKFTPLWSNYMRVPNYHLLAQLPSGRRSLSHYKIDCFLYSYLDNKTSIQQIRSFWGALTAAQRREFISWANGEHSN